MNNNKILYVYEENFSWLCLSCGNIYEARLKIESKFEDLSIMKNTFYFSDQYLEHHCPIANKNEILVKIDRNIAPAVSWFNKHGYRTEYSCEGHFESGKLQYDINNISVPYIAINNNDILDDKLIKRIEKYGWTYDRECNSIYAPQNKIEKAILTINKIKDSDADGLDKFIAEKELELYMKKLLKSYCLRLNKALKIKPTKE